MMNLFARDEPAAAELCIVFGHQDSRTSEQRVRHAARLYLDGFVPQLLVTGGVTSPGSPAEAEQMAAVAVAAGVRAEVILIEPLAGTTVENVARSVALLQERGLLAALSTVILTTCAYHTGRAKLLAQTGFPKAVRFLTCPHTEGHTAESWHLTSEGRSCVAAELANYDAAVWTLADGRE